MPRLLKLSLMDDDGVFVETPSVTRVAKEATVTEELRQELDEARSYVEKLRSELSNTAYELDEQKAVVAQLTEELSHVGADEIESMKVQLQEQKDKAKKMWHMNVAKQPSRRSCWRREVLRLHV